MAIKKVLFDENENEMEFHINDKGALYLQVGHKEDETYRGYIVLDKNDVKELISMLSEIEKEME